MVDLYKTSGSSPPGDSNARKSLTPQQAQDLDANFQEAARELNQLIQSRDVARYYITLGGILHKLHQGNGFRHLKDAAGQPIRGWAHYLRDREKAYGVESSYLRRCERIGREDADELMRLVDEGLTGPALMDLAKHQAPDQTIVKMAEKLLPPIAPKDDTQKPLAGKALRERLATDYPIAGKKKRPKSPWDGFKSDIDKLNDRCKVLVTEPMTDYRQAAILRTQDPAGDHHHGRDRPRPGLDLWTLSRP